MKTLNYILRFSLTFVVTLFLAGCNGCGDTISRGDSEDLPPLPPCAIYNFGTAVFTNVSNRSLLLDMNYNREKVISARTEKTINRITADRYQYTYTELEKRRKKGGVVTFDVCACETTYITLPSKDYHRCAMSP